MTLGSPFPPTTTAPSSGVKITRRVSSMAMSVGEEADDKPVEPSRTGLSRQVSNENLAACDSDDDDKTTLKKPSAGRASPIRCVSEFDKVVAASQPRDRSRPERQGESSKPQFPNPLLDTKMFAQHKQALRIESELQPMRLILSRLMAHNMYNRKGIFNAPVDPVALGIPDYLTVIKKPMDFGTIKAKLHALAYESRDDVASDIHLVFDNAMTYNPPQNAVHMSARELRSFFEEQLKAFVPELCQGAKSASLKVPPVAAAPTAAPTTTAPAIASTLTCQQVDGSSAVSPNLGVTAPVPTQHTAHPVHMQATRLSAAPEALLPSAPVVSRKRKKRGARVSDSHDCQWCEGRTCSICNQGCLYLEPTLLICSGPHCAGSKIRKNTTYYVAADGTRQYCNRCYIGLPAILPGTCDDDACRYKLNLLKRKNDEEIVEQWVTCSRCNNGVHASCALYNEFVESKEDFVCPDCVHSSEPTFDSKMAHAHAGDVYSFVSGSELPVCISEISESHFRFGDDILSADSLPETSESAFIQRKVRERMLSDSFPNSEKTVTVRIISDCSRSFHVPEVVRHHFQMPSKDSEDHVVPPNQVNYRSKAIALFQKIDGLDVCMFCMYVQEYDGDDDFEDPRDKENAVPTKRVYIAYLDSVEHFRPRKCRTEVFQEVLVSYLASAGKRGYETAHIWACPPSRGNSFVFWNHPASQRTPTMERLVAWYHGALSRAVDCGAVSDVNSLYKTAFEDRLSLLSGDSPPLGRKMECPPLLDGDFWLEEAVRLREVNFARNLKVKPEAYVEPNTSQADRSRFPALEVATMLRDKIMAHPSSVAFRRPVNAAALKLADYHKIILNPMDLGTVYSRLTLGEYRLLRDVVSDVELVFNNAKLYNPKGHIVHLKAIEVCQMFFAELDALVATWSGAIEKNEAKPSWKDFLAVSMNLDASLERSPASVLPKEEPSAMSIDDDDSAARPSQAPLKTDLFRGGPSAIEKRMVGTDTWLLGKQGAAASKAPGPAKKAPYRRKGEGGDGDEPSPTTHRPQSWLAMEVGDSVRRNRTSFFCCSLQPLPTTGNSESRTSTYAESLCFRNEPDTHPARVADARHALLEFSQFRNLEFDTLRRSKYSSAILLYHLHHDDAPGTIPVCSCCKENIVSVRWHRVSKVRERNRPRKRPSVAGHYGKAFVPFVPQELCTSCHSSREDKEQFIPLPVSFK